VISVTIEEGISTSSGRGTSARLTRGDVREGTR
jgi:hypothetical protein